MAELCTYTEKTEYLLHVLCVKQLLKFQSVCLVFDLVHLGL